MVDLHWLRPVVPGDLRGIALDRESLELARLDLVEVTGAGRRRLADLLVSIRQPRAPITG